MPPVEIESVIPRDVVIEEIEAPKNNLQIVGKAMELPVIADAVSLTKSTISPLVESVEGCVGPIVESYVSPVAGQLEDRVSDLKTKAEAALPSNITDSVKTNVGTVVEQAKIAASNLDKLSCEGMDILVEKVPLLKESTSVVIENTKETAASYLELFTEYAASFTVSQIALSLSDAGLSVASSVLQKTGLDTKAVDKVRRGVRAVRRVGVRRAGPSKPASTIGEVSLVGAVAEILGVNYFLSVIGLQLIPRNMKTGKKASTSSCDVMTEESVGEQLNAAENQEDYKSDEDPDYAPSEASEDSMEYDSDAEKDVVYEDEHVKVIAEPEVEQEPTIVDTEMGEAEIKEIDTEETLAPEEKAEVEDLAEDVTEDVIEATEVEDSAENVAEDVIESTEVENAAEGDVDEVIEVTE